MKNPIKFLVLLLVMDISHMSAATARTHTSVEIAEQIWMQKGIARMIDEIRVELNASDKQFFTFKAVYFRQFVSDKTYFFNTTSSTPEFVDESSANNYRTWLSERKSWYHDAFSGFLNAYHDSLYDKVTYALSIQGINACTPPTNCTNFDFESGNISSWQGYLGDACLDAAFGSAVCHSYVSVGTTTSARIEIQTSGYDALVGGTTLPVVAPGGTRSLRLENTANGGHSARISREMKVASGNSTMVYKYALVLEDPGNSHPDDAKPFFRVRVLLLDNNCTDTGEVECAHYEVIANPQSSELVEKFKRVAPGSPYYYKNWTEIAIPLVDYIGQNVRIEFTVSDCAWGGHLGYAYLDGECFSSTLDTTICASGKHSISAPKGFNSYWWSGSSILGSNYGKTIEVDEGGLYFLHASTKTDCVQDYRVTVANCAKTPADTCVLSSLTLTPTSCNDTSNQYQLNGSITFTTAPSSGMLVITDGGLSQIYYAPFTSPMAFSFKYMMSDGATHNVSAKFYTGSFFSGDFISCRRYNTYEAPDPCYVPTISACENCLTSFNPEPGRFVLSAWTKQIGSTPDKETYNKPYIRVKFSSGTTVLSKMYASGKIIDGWQRIFFEFSIPGGASDIGIDLGTDSGSALFDDIRIHPVNGSFVSYVYDPISLKLIATLDDNNYATIYEYDKEGTLLRVKKETERGIMTIKESRENSPKHD